jgi:hypothetical protein
MDRLVMDLLENWLKTNQTQARVSIAAWRAAAVGWRPGEGGMGAAQDWLRRKKRKFFPVTTPI